MRLKNISVGVCALALLACFASTAFAQDRSKKPASPPAQPAQTSPTISAPANVLDHALFVDAMAIRGVKKSPAAVPAHGNTTGPSRISSFNATLVSPAADPPSSAALPLWTFRVRSARDGNYYSGAMVGRNPFEKPGSVDVPTVVVPLVVKFHQIATAFDPNTGLLTTTSGETTFDPTAPDNVCLSSPNNVPATLVRQSPIFTPASFTFGGTYVGTTQYNDAFQRANFWRVLREDEDRDSYHVRLDPQVLGPTVIDVPDVYGTALTNGLILGPPVFCAPFGFLDINWFDGYINNTVLPRLESEGVVNPGVFPVFLVYNINWGSPANNFFTCCILGYHGITGFPVPTQTYSPADFDTSGLISTPAGVPLPGFHDTAVLSHEVDEWMNDPYTVNQTPPWGNTGQVSGCAASLEVGDPLTGTVIAPVTMPNGYTYNLQELAFFSWFFGGRSVGIHGWYSDNNTFTTDAGAPCH